MHGLKSYTLNPNYYNMKLKLILLTMVSTLMCTYAQVGINTESPQSPLDINGDLSLRQELRLKGNSTVQGNPGLNGQVLFSQDGTNEPMWKFVNVPFIEEGQIQLKYSFATVDEVGVLFPTGAGDLNPISTLGELLNGTWTIIPGLETEIQIQKEQNEVALMFQTGVEMPNVYNPSDTNKRFVKYACGIFDNDVLVAIRADQIHGIVKKNAKNQSIFTLSYILGNMPLGTHSIKVACRKISTSPSGNYELAIGRTLSTGSQVANNFMMGSNLKVDVMEYVVNN
jgi:hypothetical protein